MRSTTVVEDQLGAMMRSAIFRLREIADQLDGCADLLEETGEGSGCHTSRTVADAATHVRLTAEALEFTICSPT